MFTNKFRYALVLLLMLPCAASARDTILWQTYHRPPGIFNHGEHHGKGFVQQTLQMVIQRMPEYQHKMPITTLARALSDINAGKHACHPALYKTPEREKTMIFSAASMINPSSRIIAKHKNISDFIENGQVSLERILQDDSLIFGHLLTRSYGKAIDDVLKQHQKIENFISVENLDLSRIFQLIERDRVDVTIAHPFEIEHYIKNSPHATGELVAYPIKDISAYSIGAIACPKTPWGKEVIDKINTILKEIKPTTEFQHALTVWRESERENLLFNQYYQEYFLQH